MMLNYLIRFYFQDFQFLMRLLSSLWYWDNFDIFMLPEQLLKWILIQKLNPYPYHRSVYYCMYWDKLTFFLSFVCASVIGGSLALTAWRQQYKLIWTLRTTRQLTLLSQISPLQAACHGSTRVMPPPPPSASRAQGITTMPAPQTTMRTLGLIPPSCLHPTPGLIA